MSTSDDPSRSAARDVSVDRTNEMRRFPAVAHDPSRLVGRVVDTTIDGLRRSCRIIAVGAGGVQLLDQRSRRGVLVPHRDVAALRLAPSEPYPPHNPTPTRRNLMSILDTAKRFATDSKGEVAAGLDTATDSIDRRNDGRS